MSYKTLGEKPKSFKFEEDGESFYLGSEVGNYLRLFRGTLYKKYPSLWRRPATLDEKRQLLKLGITQHTIMVNVMLLKGHEVDDIFEGKDGKYKTISITTHARSHQSDPLASQTNRGSVSGGKKVSAIQQALASANLLAPPFNLATFTANQYANTSGNGVSVANITSNANNNNMNIMMALALTGGAAATSTTGELAGNWNNSYHLDAVPSATPVTRARANKRIRNYEDILKNTIEEMAILPDQLIPIRLDMEIEGNKIRDCFIWNKKYSASTPVGLRMIENFAEILCEDLQLLPVSTYLSAIVQTMRQQIDCHFDNYHLHHKQSSTTTNTENTTAKISENSLPATTANLLNTKNNSNDDTIANTVSLPESKIKKEEETDELEKDYSMASLDQRVVMKLNIHVGNVSLVDQFEWDISDPNNDPEQFALVLCKELGLGGEFLTSIAYSIRGQIAYHHRTYAFNEAPLSTIDNAFRGQNEVENWGPVLETLTDAEMEKKIRDQDRNTRRMRRLANIAAPNW